MKKSLLLLVAAFIFLSGCASPWINPLRCLNPVRYENDYRGKIIDADAKEPIEGVVVVGTWWSILWSPGGGISDYYDAREAVTDKNGEFRIPGKGLKILSNLDNTINILIFKEGYEYIGPGLWESYKKYSDKFKTMDKMVIISLKKLTVEERRKQGDPPIEAPEEKIRMLLKEINKDRVGRGLAPINFRR